MQMDLKCNAHEKAHKHTLQIDISFSHGKKGPFSLKSKTELGGQREHLDNPSTGVFTYEK